MTQYPASPNSTIQQSQEISKKKHVNSGTFLAEVSIFGLGCGPLLGPSPGDGYGRRLDCHICGLCLRSLHDPA